MKFLLVYGTSEGQTQKISRFVTDRAAERGHQATPVNAADPAPAPDLRDFDGVIIAASLHAGRYQPAVIHYVREHRSAIDSRPNAFLSVSLAAASDDRQEAEGLRKCIAQFIHDTGWTPRNIHHVVGALRYSAYGFLERWALRYIAWRKGGPTDTSRDHELTDWDDLARFVDSFVNSPAPAGANQILATR